MQFSHNPFSSLTLFFVLYKAILLFVACTSPGLGYDTSTDLLGNASAMNLSSSYAYIPSKLVRWDAVYFVSTAKRGYVYEQEWAFGWGLSKTISFLASLMSGSSPSIWNQAWAGIIVANVSHLLSVLVLFQLARLLQPKKIEAAQWPFIAACMHIIAPAGIFLSAPYGESLFSLLNFTGVFAYCLSRKTTQEHASRRSLQDLFLVASGLLFGLAATVRSNAILNGTIFAYDLVLVLPNLPNMLTRVAGLRYLVCLASAGILLAAGFVGPQAIAYGQYCTVEAIGPEGKRVWCQRMLPSIYTFVQEHYWNVGFLRYWTLSNIPLFALALPMLCLLLYTGLGFLMPGLFVEVQSTKSTIQADRFPTTCLQRIAIPQILLAILAITSFHVQVITRVASGYPLVYLWLASLLLEPSKLRGSLQRFGIVKATTSYMIIYALVQAGLYASFLPPA